MKTMQVSVNLRKKKNDRFKVKVVQRSWWKLLIFDEINTNILEAEFNPSRLLNSIQKHNTHYNQTIGQQRENVLKIGKKEIKADENRNEILLEHY